MLQDATTDKDSNKKLNIGIFKKENKYYLKFIDPHGVQFIGNSADKIDGFNDFVSDLTKLKNKNIHSAELYFYNKRGVPHGVDKNYRKYWTGSFNKIFTG